MRDRGDNVKPIEFPEVNVVLGDGQSQLPVYASQSGRVTCCFEVSPEELAEIVRTGRIWMQQLTFGRAFQPIMLTTYSPFVPPRSEQN